LKLVELSKINRRVLNSALFDARAVTKAPKFHHINPFLKSPLAQDK